MAWGSIRHSSTHFDLREPYRNLFENLISRISQIALIRCFWHSAPLTIWISPRSSRISKIEPIRDLAFANRTSIGFLIIDILLHLNSNRIPLRTANSIKRCNSMSARYITIAMPFLGSRIHGRRPSTTRWCLPAFSILKSRQLSFVVTHQYVLLVIKQSLLNG